MAGDIACPAIRQHTAPSSLTTVGPGSSLIPLKPEQRFPEPQVIERKP